MESPAVGCQLSSDNPLSLYFALTTHFDGSVGSGIIDLNAQIRSMASKSSFDKTLLADTQKSQVLPGFFGTRRGEVRLTLREAEVLPAKRAKNEGNGAKISSVTLI